MANEKNVKGDIQLAYKRFIFINLWHFGFAELHHFSLLFSFSFFLAWTLVDYLLFVYSIISGFSRSFVKFTYSLFMVLYYSIFLRCHYSQSSRNVFHFQVKSWSKYKYFALIFYLLFFFKLSQVKLICMPSWRAHFLVRKPGLMQFCLHVTPSVIPRISQ